MVGRTRKVATLQGGGTAMNASTPPPPSDPWAPGVRAIDVPVANGGHPNPLDTPPQVPPGNKGDPNPREDLFGGFKTTAAPLQPNKVDISQHLFQLFSPPFANDYPDAQIEIAYADMKGSEKPDKAERFSVFKLKEAADF